MKDWEVLSKTSDLDSLKETILKERLNSLTEKEFFSPPHPVNLLNDRFFDSEVFENIKKSKQIIFESIDRNHLILIHGDYDADGVCATAILYNTITHVLNYKNCFTFIPDRFEDGYGLSDKSTQKLLDLAFNQNFLLITVDCGITSVSQVSFLKSLGNKVIITDHHHKPDTLPEADAIVWSDKVVGSTLSWLLSLGLGNKDPKIMSLASIATVTDVFPLTGFNRSIVKHGIDVLRNNPPISIETILDFNNKNYKDISVYDLGFVIGPRLNSSGRIGSADTSLELLNSSTREKAWESVSIINGINLQRQKITEESLDKFEIEAGNLPKIIIVFNEEFHEGVMGLIASKIVQKYHRPALVISKNEGKYKGSARSIKGINIIDILKKFSDNFISVGGHELAAGFSLDPEKYEIIKTQITNYLDQNFENFNFNKILRISAEISLDLINYQLLDFLESLEPYGNGNEEPLFCTYAVVITELRFIGENKNHLSIMISNGLSSIKGIYFNFDKSENEIYLGIKIDIVYKIRKNEYKGKNTIDLNIVDIRKSNA